MDSTRGPQAKMINTAMSEIITAIKKQAQNEVSWYQVYVSNQDLIPNVTPWNIILTSLDQE